jgi:hypothetical protein
MTDLYDSNVACGGSLGGPRLLAHRSVSRSNIQCTNLDYYDSIVISLFPAWLTYVWSDSNLEIVCSTEQTGILRIGWL